MSKLTALLKARSVLKPITRSEGLAEDVVRKPKMFSGYKVLVPKTVHEYTEARFHPVIPTMYGGVHTVSVIPGAGIGPELWVGVKQVLDACRAPLDYDEVDMSPAEDVDKCNRDFIYGLMSIKRNGVALKGGIESHACDPTDYSRNVALRRNLGLYANVIEYKSYPGVKSVLKDVDLVIVRQNSEGEYLMLEHQLRHGVVQNMKIVTAFNSERTARFAFELAKKQGRKLVTVTHRRHILPMADSLFTDSVIKVAKEFPEIKLQDKHISNVLKRLPRDPNQFGMILCTNLTGSMMTNIMMGLLGSPALMSGRNYGEDVAVFESGHRNKGETIAGKNMANPTAMLNAAIDLLHHLHHHYHACLIEQALDITINVDKVHTFDLGGEATLQDVIDNVINRLADVDPAKCPAPWADTDKVKVKDKNKDLPG